MGGGGAMRAAAKVVGCGVASSTFRGFTPNHQVIAAARPVSVSALSSVSDDVGEHVLSAPENPAAVQKPYFGFDDWEFPDKEETPLPRLVFGGAPTLQEAKEATADLKEAIENEFLWPANHSQATGADLVLNSYDLKTKSCASSESTVSTPSEPRHAVRALRFLKESVGAQTVVASIACDPNVWEAVMENPEVKKFLGAHVSNPSFAGDNLDAEESVADNGSSYEDSPRSGDGPKSGGGFADFLSNIKAAVNDMMNSLSGFFQNLFGGYNIFPEADGSAKINVEAVGASLMGLAVMVIMVVVLKRA